jgi:hypothetical protein
MSRCAVLILQQFGQTGKCNILSFIRKFQLSLLVQITTLFNDLVKFINEDRMLKKTYLYENIIFRSKIKLSIIWGGKGKDKVMLLKS